eukprot:TRINITY_DN110885_c0_g1_i1.p1 TRINITY_DN110885_c0_g1~~TRINITY_DN110885_c0_g1_i1.p1  ORF type:complete len:220 (-),score=37.12 TRINITY_DN110885_c0_g1_i1:34-693(-)
MHAFRADGNASRSADGILYIIPKDQAGQVMTVLPVGCIGKTKLPTALPSQRSNVLTCATLGDCRDDVKTMEKYPKASKSTSWEVYDENSDNAGRLLRQQLRSKGNDVLYMLGHRLTRHTKRRGSRNISDCPTEVPNWLIPRKTTPTFYANFKAATLHQACLPAKEQMSIAGPVKPSKKPMKVPVAIRNYHPERVSLKDPMTMPFVSVPDALELTAELAW